eukprot:gene8496-biopygen3839
MVLQNSGPIKLSDLAAQFGQTAAAGQNLKLSEYRRGGAYGVLAAVGANAAAPNVPSYNYNIKMSDFYGAYKIKTPVLNTIPTLTGTNTSANVTFSMASSYLVSSSNYGTVTWTMTGNPTGETINSSTGVITATAGTSVNNSITVTATGPGAIPVSKTFTMTLTTTRIIPSFPGVNNNAFVYAVIPGGPRTVLNYLQSFGVANTSTNNNDSLWSGGHDTLYYVGGQNSGTDFFSLYNRARVIQGDGSADGADWVVFNFTQDLNGDFDGKYQTTGYFGGESASSGGSMGTQELDGYIYGWGNNVWNILYKLPLGTRTSSFNHTNGNWFMSGGTVTSGYGKYSDFDSLNVTDIGFGVSSRFITSLSPVVDTAKTSIELLGGTLFATPTVGALAERLRKTTLITGVGKFNTEKLAVTFTKLYGMYFLNDVQQFTIEWTFTDRTNSFDSFFNKANTTNYGATYTFNVFNASGAAQDHSAYVRNGELFIYGRNDYGQLGLGHTSNTITVPTKVPGINKASLVACGEGFTLCVRTDGTAISTGLNDNGQLGIGSDANGQLGRGASSANVVINSNIVPMLMPDGSNVPARSISAGGYHSAVLLNNGSAYLCGKNDQGQCGASTTLVPQANSLGIIPSLLNVVDVACGHEHTLFTCYDGQVLGVGRNDCGQLGQGNKTSPVTSVVQVLAGGGAGSKNGLLVEIAAGFNHSALIKNDSTIFVFGANDKGQLGLGETTTESLTPTQLVGYAGYDIACGRNHTVISTTPDPLVFNFTGNNALIAFGDNAYGQTL